jgi:DNA-binding FrmR family transcriptional regulator
MTSTQGTAAIRREDADPAPATHPHGGHPNGPHPGGAHSGSHADHFRHSYSKDKAQLVRRLARIEGQVRGIARMIEREEYCVDILQQTAALRAAVDSLAVLVLEQGDAERYVEEVVDVVRRTLGRPVRGTRGS